MYIMEGGKPPLLIIGGGPVAPHPHPCFLLHCKTTVTVWTAIIPWMNIIVATFRDTIDKGSA